MKINPLNQWKSILKSFFERRRINIGIGVSLLGIVCAVALSIFLFYSYLGQFSRILEDQNTNQNLKTAFHETEEAFQHYAWNRQDKEIRKAYETACSRMENQLKKLPAGYEDLGRERYLKTMAVLHGYEGYSRKCGEVLKLSDTAENYVDRVYDCYQIGSYIQTYIDRLINTTLQDGNQLYRRQLERIRYLPLIWMLLGFLILLCVYSFGKAVKNSEVLQRQQEKELLLLQSERTLSEMQMRLLQSQINPHFLFNTLNIIAGTARIEEAKVTKEMIERLSKLFRYNLKTESEVVALMSEIDIAKDYFYIQQRRFGERISLEWDVQVDPSSIFLPTFTFQPLLENAILHGLMPREEGGRIRIRVFQRDRHCYLHITDNGAGIRKEHLKELRRELARESGNHIGIGVSNVRARFRMLFPGSSFTLYSKDGWGTTVSIIWKID